MDGRGMRAENIGELQIWIEGQFGLITQAQKRCEDDLKGVRERLHDFGGELMKLAALDIEGKFRILTEQDEKHTKDIKALQDAALERKGAWNALKIIYTTTGAAAGAALTMIAEIAGLFHR